MDKDNEIGFELGLDKDVKPQCDLDLGKSDLPEYKVGYGHPPKDKQFKRGQSGNPKGRPKHPVTVKESLNKIMSTYVTVTEDGVRKKKTILELSMKKYANELLKGNMKAMSLFIRENARDINIEYILYPREPVAPLTPEQQAKQDELMSIVHGILDERYH